MLSPQLRVIHHRIKTINEWYENHKEDCRAARFDIEPMPFFLFVDRFASMIEDLKI